MVVCANAESSGFSGLRPSGFCQAPRNNFDTQFAHSLLFYLDGINPDLGGVCPVVEAEAFPDSKLFWRDGGMYSLVMMAALSTGTNAPAHWFSHGCHGCAGCFGCNGCYGSCSGCYGSCHGCWGSCHGCWSISLGCRGGCNGCYGSYAGCYGCYGSCYGCYGAGCYGGAGYGSPGHGSPGYGGDRAWGTAPGAMPPAMDMRPAEPLPRPEKKSDTKPFGTPQARLIVELPADAKLYVDDRLMKTMSARREFHTPSLIPGQTYYYILRAEVERDGQKHMQTKQILVRAGEEVRTSFPELQQLAGPKMAATSKR